MLSLITCMYCTVATRLTSTSKFSYISHYIKFSSKLTIRNIVTFKESLAVEPFHREATPLLLDLSVSVRSSCTRDSLPSHLSATPRERCTLGGLPHSHHKGSTLNEYNVIRRYCQPPNYGCSCQSLSCIHIPFSFCLGN